jgi:hypothetical protein
MGRRNHSDCDDVGSVDDAQTDGDAVDLPRRYDSVLIPLLAAGHSQRAAAERAGCAQSLVERRVQDPQFRLELIEAHQEIRDGLMASSVSAAQAATGFLLGIVQGRELAPMSVRVRAAIALRQGIVSMYDREAV